MVYQGLLAHVEIVAVLWAAGTSAAHGSAPSLALHRCDVPGEVAESALGCKGDRNSSGRDGIPRAGAVCTNPEKTLQAKAGKRPTRSSCLGAAWVRAAGPAQGHGISGVRNPKSSISLRLNASANECCLTLGQEVAKVECVCVCCRGHLIPLSFGRAESPWGPADNTRYIDVLITALCFQPEFAFLSNLNKLIFLSILLANKIIALL